MQVGIEVTNEHGSPRASAVAGMAQAAERLGYATIWAGAATIDPARAAEHLVVAARAAVRVRVGINGEAPAVLAMVDHLASHREELRGRLRVALPTRPSARNQRWDARLDGADGIRVGSLVRVDDLDELERDVLGEFVVVRLEIAAACDGDRGPAASTLDRLFAVRDGGADEVVLAANCVTDVDRTMAAYAALAEALEIARA